ncbi:conserved hypothetical protein [Aspergillus terreus NIH2624]|uniref:Uncharacterized protein n=1 Tax=Aspergillus terreus (strain NIH 2624 / FGSC A1156) TaxID=341663 RepID=Q0CAB3_ASPTN|nr:uncharacterized protein ATEG_09371 [Aspergillus terreus NIH2624]EAU30508.1 conserved hypothetical protein [Aspergillus terreus NIH2624]
MTGRDSDKGHRYVAALDNARCQNKWDELPELIRKVTKHAPQKTCLLEVASAEYQIAQHLQKSPSSARPSSAASYSVSELIPSLLSTIDKAEGSHQDVFQAQICLGWVHWALNEPALAAARLPRDFGETLNTLTSSGEELSSWTKVCLVKGCYIKGMSWFSDSLTAWLSSHGQSSSNNPQFLHWSEKLLAEGALLAGDEACKDLAAPNDELVKTALKIFRAWSNHPHVKQGLPSQSIPGSTGPSASKSLVWKSYYDLLSAILQHGLAYAPAGNGPERPQLASEIKRIESICESNLLREVKFPTADASNTQIEEWVEQVIRNWEVLCGSHWNDADLGEGGQDAVGRNVLDILYRAATKTYHSHLILRRLFHVHSALAEFDLAVKALDSYIEIVVSAKERAEKSAQYGELENDGILLRTLSEGVIMLCCFGSAKEAEKARDLVVLLKKFVNKHVQEDNDGQGNEIRINPETSSTRSQMVIPSDVAMAYRGIGIGLANWASWTPVSEKRDDIRAEAIEYLEKSLAPELEDESNYSSLYTLALLLAEDRDIDGAIEYVKSALTTTTHPGSSRGDFTRERDLVPLWHLLALLLSAKNDFDIAERSCEAAFEQFPAAVTSLAHKDRRPQKQQHGTQDPNANGMTHAFICQLRGREKERIIETRMSQLAFVEVMESPEAAVNHSEQLLSLFATLFGNLDLEAEDKLAKSNQLLPPKSSAGTVKSFRGSIFGRHKKAESTIASRPEIPHPPSVQAESRTDNTPAIHVTDEEKGAPPGTSHTLARSDSRKLRKRSSTLKNQDATHVNGDGPSPVASVDGTRTPQANGEEMAQQDMVGLAISSANQEQSAKQQLPPVSHNMKHTHQPAPAGHSKQPPEQDVRLPTSYGFDSPTRAVTKFPLTQAQRHALCILVKIWLLIAGLYRRASLFEDAREACEEASKHIARVEALVAAQDSSARGLRERGWGVPRSSEELWADLYTEQGLLLNVQSRPHEAMQLFEQALIRDPDHPKAIIALSNLLLDIWEQKLPLEPPEPEIETDLSMLSLVPKPSSASKQDDAKQGKRQSVIDTTQAEARQVSPSTTPDEEPKLLNRIAARDRAYGMLSALTKRGTSWDNTEAWYALSRAYEAQGQVEKLKEVLWWCIELEDRRPIRHWSNIGSGVYVL